MGVDERSLVISTFPISLLFGLMMCIVLVLMVLAILSGVGGSDMSNKPVAWVEFVFLGSETRLFIGGDGEAKDRLKGNDYLHTNFVAGDNDEGVIVKQNASHKLYLWCMNNASEIAGCRKFKLSDRRTVFYFVLEK